jgi:hypothetical protein
MSSFPGSPRVLKGGIVLIDADSSAVLRVIALQYNPDTLTRTLQVQGAGAESGDHLEALRLKGPPIETLKLDVEIDAADQMEIADRSSTVSQVGIHPQLAALEMIVYPASSQIQDHKLLALIGTIEITPQLAPLTLFVWSKNRIIPVRLTDFSITEEAFDPQLNPIRAKISLGMRVLSYVDLGFDHKGSSLFTAYHQQKERLAAKNQNVPLTTFGIREIP